MCFGSESKARMRGLWLLKHANKAEKKMGLRTGLPSIYKSRLHSQLCLLEDLLHVACLRTMLTHDMSSHHHHNIKMSQFKSIYYINEYHACRIQASIIFLSSALTNTARTSSFTASGVKSERTTGLSEGTIVSKLHSWTQEPSCDVDGSRRLPHQTEDQHRLRATCTTATDILILTSTPVHPPPKSKTKKTGLHTAVQRGRSVVNWP